MACTSLSNHTLSFLNPQSRTPKTPSPHSLPIPIKQSHSQIYGLKFHTLTISSPTPPPSKPTIFAKVSKGDTVPNVTLKDQDGKNVSLSKFKGKPVVLYFYPADETPGCTKQGFLREVQEGRCRGHRNKRRRPFFSQGIYSKYQIHSQSYRAFAKKYRLPFTLLSDEGNKVRKDWGVPSDLFGTLPGRQTYVIDRKGVVQSIYNNQFQPEKHIDETLKILQSI